LRRLSAYSSEETPVVYVTQKYSRFSGGSITTQNDHGFGIVLLGHKTLDSTYDATNWRFERVDLSGVQETGNVGIRAQSSQPYGTGKANYFGHISNINIISSDYGIELTEMVNAHTIANVQFWHMKTAAYWFHGAIENSVFGGFLHTSLNGVIGIKLDNKKTGSGADSKLNSFYGVHMEPGGDLSKSVSIESGCNGNTIMIMGNVDGGTAINNLENVFFNYYSPYRLPISSSIKVGIIDFYGPTVRKGTGSPEGVVEAARGSVFLRTDGGAGATFYVKETASGATGWVVK
jgi:hypothetical protein